MLQLENEFGSYGDVRVPADAAYIRHLQATAKTLLGPGAVQLYTTDGGDTSFLERGALKGEVFATGDGNDVALFDAEDPFNPDGWRAHTSSEFYSGWLTHWGETMANTSTLTALGQLTQFFARGGSASIYTAHGGTNWGFSSGANANADGSGYAPVITSYDYSAPVAEGGGHGFAIDGDKYEGYRALLSYWNPEAVPAEPPSPPVAAYGTLFLNGTAPLWPNQDRIVKPFKQQGDVHSMEWYNISRGWALYTGTAAPRLSGSGNAYLALGSNSDLVQAFGTNSVQLSTAPIGFIARGGGVAPNPVNSIFSGNGAYPDVLLENQGRINYGKGMDADSKMWGGMQIWGFGTTMGQVVYDLSLDYATGWAARLPWGATPTATAPMTPLLPRFFRGFLAIDSAIGPRDTYVSLCGWGKGVLWVNGAHVGRYWDARGPQHTLYVPAVLLHAGADNEVIVFETNTTTTGGNVTFVDAHDFTGAGCSNSSISGGGGDGAVPRYPTAVIDAELAARGRRESGSTARARAAAIFPRVEAWRAARASSKPTTRNAAAAACTAAPSAGLALTLQPCADVSAAATSWTLVPAKSGLTGGHWQLTAGLACAWGPTAPSMAPLLWPSYCATRGTARRTSSS